MPRRYTVTSEATTATAASDLLQIKGAANKVLIIVRWWWRPYDNTLATAQVLATRCRRLPATVTDGNGSAITPRAYDFGDVAATFTALGNNTTKATTNGTATIHDEAGAHIYNGYDQQPEKGIIIAPSQSFVFELLNSTVQNAPLLQFGAEVDEIG
jgi:hypothetical protein